MIEARSKSQVRRLIHQLKAGRELDLLVEERVLGFVWDESKCRICGWRLKGSVDDGCVIDNCSQRPAPKIRADEPGLYSTDIRVAWVVVDKMMKSGDWKFVLWSNGGNYSAEFQRHKEGSIQIVATADEAPEAICSAALRLNGSRVHLRQRLGY